MPLTLQCGCRQEAQPLTSVLSTLRAGYPEHNVSGTTEEEPERKIMEARKAVNIFFHFCPFID
jgi:hypothetical protein